MGSDDKWDSFIIHCLQMTEETATYVVTFNARALMGPGMGTAGAIVLVEAGSVLIATEFKPPEVATPGISEHDYTDKAFEIVREHIGQQ